MNTIHQFCPKNHDTFIVGRTSGGGCKTCVYDKYKEYTKVHSEKYKKIQKFSKIKAAYAITELDFEDLLDLQKNKCAICLRVFTNSLKPFVDHNHKSNKVRGLLCINCNSILGHAHDDIDVLESAAIYLGKLYGRNV